MCLILFVHIWKPARGLSIAVLSRRIYGLASTDCNIKCGSCGNMEYKWAYFTLQSRRKRRTDFLLCNKSFPFRQLCALRALFNTICIGGRRVNWFTLHKKQCCGRKWNTFDLLTIMNLRIEKHTCADRGFMINNMRWERERLGEKEERKMVCWGWWE